ncbi:tetratricopeptide repeat protein [Lutibacter holmesii]|uniref:histidine kinase n=1 Tax=Lutibacter holmesii TaxID=1137985 RepID=A0ABW3WQ78_9FLAO
MNKSKIKPLYFLIFCLISWTAISQEAVNSTELTSKKAYEYFTKGYHLVVANKKDSAYFYYNKANEIYRHLNDSTGIGQTLVFLAIVESDLGDYTSSESTGIEAIKYLPKNNIDHLTSVYNCLAISSRKQQDYHEALYWYNKALQITSNNNFKILYLQNKANVYRDLKEYNKAIVILDSLRSQEIGNAKTNARIIDNLAYTKWLGGDTAVVPELKRALNMRITQSDTWGQIASYAHLSDVFKKNNPTLALSYAKKMYGMAIKSNSPQDQLEALEKIIALDTSPNLKGFYTRYVYINDSLNTAKNYAKNTYAKLKFDSEQNREENYRLKISSAENELALQKEQTRNTIGAVSMGAILVMLFIYGYFRKQKHQQEKRAEVYQTETRIAKKIHDEVANNVVDIMNKLQYVNTPKENLLDDLESVYLLTRDISHQHKVIETGAHFVQSLKSMLVNFNATTTTVILKNLEEVGLEKISETKQIEIYRVLQELMVNMQKYSAAKLVALTFEKNQKEFKIQYADNGVGVDLETLEIKNGLSNVETRIKSIQGMITFTSALNKGFKALIIFKE